MQQRELDWAALMRAAKGGDAAAYQRLLRQIAVALRPVASRCLARAGQPHLDPDDIVQEVLLAVHLKRHTLDPAAPLMPWLRAVVHHKTVDSMRRRGFQVHVPIEDFSETLAAPEPERTVSEAEVAQRLAALPPGQREVVRSISVAGASITETAARLEMTEVAVRVALHRGLATLAKGQG